MVDVIDNGYAPGLLHVRVGATITWVQRGGSSHNVQSQEWDSGPLGPDQTFSHTFQAPGEYSYWCSYHSGMRGRVVVVP